MHQTFRIWATMYICWLSCLFSSRKTSLNSQSTIRFISSSIKRSWIFLVILTWRLHFSAVLFNHTKHQLKHKQKQIYNTIGFCLFFCRNCGNVFCKDCCHLKLPIPDQQLYDPVLVCNTCHDHLLESRTREIRSQQLKKAIATASSWEDAQRRAAPPLLCPARFGAERHPVGDLDAPSSWLQRGYEEEKFVLKRRRTQD